MKRNIFTDREALARFFGDQLVQLTKENEKVNVALSGGSTPQVIFNVLAKEYADKINWKALHFYWGDERCVAPEHQESNFRMTKEHLFDPLKISDKNIFRVKGELSPDAACADYINTINKELPIVNDLPQFDLMILGMGDDGHTASIFPHQIELWDSTNVCEVATHPESGQKRVTLTGTVINNSKEIIFLVTGSNKAEKAKEILEKTGDYNSYPAFKVAPEKTTWLMDEEAAKLLK